MFTRLALTILALAWASVVLAAPEPPARDEIRLPVIDLPAPQPTSPTAVTKLTASQLYVIDSNVELLVVASRDGLVSITPEAGPLSLRGVFVDDPTGKPTRKTFKGPYLYVVEAVKSGNVELVIFKDVKTPAIRRTIDVDAGQGPIPPPLDEFAASLKLAYGIESPAEQAYLPQLRSLYAKSADIANDPASTTWGKVYEAMGVVAKSSKLSGRLQKLQVPIARLLESIAPPGDNSDIALSVADRSTLLKAFAKITAALGSIQ